MRHVNSCDGYAPGRELACARCRVPESAGSTITGTHVRWGAKDCGPQTNTTDVNMAQTKADLVQVYTGFAAGPWFEDSEGGHNLLCMHHDSTLPLADADGNPGYNDGQEPAGYSGGEQQEHNSNMDWTQHRDDYNEGRNRGPQVYGVEYWANTNRFMKDPKYTYDLQGDNGQTNYRGNVACAVCGSNNKAQHIVWGRETCPYGGWEVEYVGLAMTSRWNYQRQKVECIDYRQQSTDYEYTRATDDRKSWDNDMIKGPRFSNRIYTLEFTTNLFASTYKAGHMLPCVLCSMPQN